MDFHWIYNQKEIFSAIIFHSIWKKINVYSPELIIHSLRVSLTIHSAIQGFIQGFVTEIVSTIIFHLKGNKVLFPRVDNSSPQGFVFRGPIPRHHFRVYFWPSCYVNTPTHIKCMCLEIFYSETDRYYMIRFYILGQSCIIYMMRNVFCSRAVRYYKIYIF